MIKKLSLISLFTMLPASFYFAQTTVFAYLKDADGKPVEKAQVSLKGEGNDVTADKIGYFQFVDLKSGHYQVVVSKPNFETKTLEFDVTTEKRKDLGVITLYSTLTGVDQGLVILDNGNDEDNNTQSSTVGLLQSSQDVFNRTASFDLGAYWFRPRGVDGRTGDTMMNGVSMAGADDGNVDFGTWGGLNEITRYPEIAQNHAPSEYGFGGIASVINKYTKASEYRKGSQLTYSFTNRNYNHRLSYRFSSGMSKKGWAFTGMIARRWAEEGIQEGTFYDALGLYLGIEKKLGNHTITLNGIGSPYKRSTSSPNTQEVYDYMGVHYNSYWGWQDGEKRNERVRKGFQPVIQLTDFWNINKKSKLTTTLSYQFGLEKASRLDWYKAQNPSPTYYKNLPSYYQKKLYLNNLFYGPDYNGNASLQEGLNNTTNWWTNDDENHTQIDWARLYAANRGTKNNANMPAFEQGRAVYYLVNDVKDDKIWNAATHYTYDFTDKSKFILNVAYQNYRSEQYREVNDLLGADFALNMDAFAKESNGGKFNINETGDEVKKKEGDKIAYDYIYRRQEIKINPGFKFSTGNFDVFVAGLFGYTTNSREGLFSHYLYKSSYGKSADQNFWNYGLKGQVTYRLNGRNFLVYNGAYFSQAPYVSDVFINARVSNTVSPNLKNAIIDANDLSYVLSTPLVKVRLTGYIINTQNDTNVQRFFADGINLQSITTDGTVDSAVPSTFVSQVMSNVEKRNMGGELGVQVKLTPTLTFNGVASYGEYTYRNNPNIYLIADAAGVLNDIDANGNVVARNYKEFGSAYLKDYKLGGTPQEAYSAGLRYSSPKYWWVGANWNYLGHNYLDPAAATRTISFVQNENSNSPYDLTEALLKQTLQQRQLPSAYFFNVNAGKSWIIGKYYVLISASVNNVLNNRKYITGGFEQTREVNFDGLAEEMNSGHANFSPKYWYNQGISYFVNLQVRF